MKYSIIIPTYNEKNLDKTIKSIRRQTYPNFEIIIVNDGGKYLLYETFYENVLLINKPKNQGRPKAINTGLKNAKGKYICIIDADCIAPKDWLEKIDREFRSDIKLDAIGGAYEPLQNDILSLAGNLIERVSMDIGITQNTLPGGNSVYKTSVLKAIGGYPLIKWGADTYLSQKLKKKGYKIKFNNKITVKTTYPNTIKEIIKRKFYWGGGLANVIKEVY